MPEISIRAEEIFEIAGFGVTNALLLSLVSGFLLLACGALLRRKLSLLPGRFQSVFELFTEQALTLMDSVLGERRTSERYFPLIATIFLFVLTSNWLGLFPGIGAIEIASPKHGDVPLLRSPASDLNFTIALAVISVISVNLLGVFVLGMRRYFSKFFTLKNPLLSFAGILELVSEFIKIISFSFRLFGNIFAGEVLLIIVGSLVPWLLPLPFLTLEIFVGFIQAFIFAMLTLVFAAAATREETAHA